ncbi:lipocalin family protein [Psychroserpens algicola]|uniref:Lipocalin family protein n=1 Tax=Psychroserpens algicola TaxID=1719034 RepID=A0ABT0H794_9FLAO|nr:lipocalin family protein [Psychroserpens algicola]MCK8480241.1 lipocalin family protein [Psychroserpens algicola]
MKKIILALSVFALLFTSCSSDDDSGSRDPFIGNWIFFQSLENGTEVALEDCEYETTIVITSSGTFTTSLYDDDLDGGCELEFTVSGTWENLGNGQYATTTDGDTFVQDINFEGNTMSFEDVEDGVTYTDVFIRQ